MPNERWYKSELSDCATNQGLVGGKLRSETTPQVLSKLFLPGDTVPRQASQFSSTNLADLLADLNQQGGFPIAVLTDQHGLPIASAAEPGQDSTIQSAVVALIQKVAGQVRQQLGMAQTDEISLFDTNGRRLVCRPFHVNGYDLILAVIVPNKNQGYRRLTNKAVNTIKRNWNL